MKFRYKRFGTEFVRPVIPIEILYEDSAIRYEALVDSGADCNIVPAELGELLGIDIENGHANSVSGITGGGMSYFTHEVTIRIGGWSFDVPMGFMPNMPSFGYGVVGQQGFFDLFRVIFDRKKGEIELKPY